MVIQTMNLTFPSQLVLIVSCNKTEEIAKTGWLKNGIFVLA